MKWFLILAGLLVFQAHAENADYRKLSDDCRSCNEIDALVIKHNTELSPDNRLDLALKIAKVIEKMSIRNKPEVEQRREIYFAMNATFQVMDDDFDSETSVRMLDLRGQSPKSFDYVLWRFPLAQQNRLIERMRSFIEDKVRPKQKLPEAKVIEP